MEKIKSRNLFIILIFLLQWGAVEAKVIEGYMNNYLFYSAENTPYLETVIQINGKSVNYRKNSPDKYRGKINVSLTYFHDSSIVKQYQYYLNTPEVADTSAAPDAIDLKRLDVPVGVTKVLLLLTDFNNSLRFTQSISQKIEVVPLGSEGMSDIELIDHYSAEKEHNIFCKNGYEIVPRNLFSYGKSDSNIVFYAEFYHLNNIEPGTVTYVYSLTKALDNSPVPGKTGYSRQKSDAYFVLLAHIGINDLPKGNYLLNIDAYNSKGIRIAHRSQFFKRYTESSSANTLSLGLGIFESISADSLDFYLKAIYYSIGDGYKQTIANCMQGKDTLAKRICLRDFWYSQNTDNPEGDFRVFQKNVLFVEKNFAAVKKHGFQTDRGRVYLQYGPPDYVDGHRHDLSHGIYDIWQYYQTKDLQNNVLFLFLSIDNGTENLKLVNSTARGEINDPNYSALMNGTAPSNFGDRPNNIH